MTSTWRAIHLYGQDQDAVLTRVIDPVLADARRGGLIERSFFLRYWNGGSHLRLRFESSNPAGDPTDELRRRLLDRSLSLPRQRGDERSYRRGAKAMIDLERSLGGSGTEVIEPLHADGDVTPRAYTFDRHRYGSTQPDVVHDHFFVSSQLALAVVLIAQGRPTLRRLVAAYLSAAVMAAPGWDRARAAEWFREMASWNDPPATGPPSNAIHASDIAGDLSGWITDRQLPSWPDAPTQIVSSWAAELSRYASALTASRDEGALPVDLALFDAVHLMSNRIGLSLADECRIYRLIGSVCARTVETGELSAR